MAIKRNPLSDKDKKTNGLNDQASQPTGQPVKKMDDFINQAKEPPIQEVKIKKVYPWEESGPEIVKQFNLHLPLPKNLKLQLFCRISRKDQ